MRYFNGRAGETQLYNGRLGQHLLKRNHISGPGDVIVAGQWGEDAAIYKRNLMLTSRQAELLCGCGSTTINRWLQVGRVKGIAYRSANLISKESLAEYLASPAGQRVSAKTAFYSEIIEGLQVEQNSGMEFGSMSL